jgi:CMP-N-acetylneuraminic acid synthetase
MYLPCFIFARKGSKGLKNKNRINFLNKPLIQHTINHAKNSKFINKIIISTDDKEIYKIALKNNCDVIYPRSKLLSNDRATSVEVLKDAVKFCEKKFGKFDIYTYLQVTEPLRPINIIDKCILNLKKNKNLNSSFAGYEVKSNFWIKNKKSYNLIVPNSETKKPRQKRKKIFREDCGVGLASRRDALKNSSKVFSKPFKIVSYNGVRGLIDIHTKEDLILAEILVKKFKLKM